MAVQLADVAVDSGEHVVQFYEDDAHLVRTVGGYLTAAIGDGAVTIVIATDRHRRLFEDELAAAGFDPISCCLDGRLIHMDAAETLAACVDQGRVDHDRFRENVGSVVQRAADTGRPVRAYGEMVALLWEAGDLLAAIELEKAWNALAREVPFALVCGYRSESVRGEENAQALRQVCDLHSSVRSAKGDAAPASPPVFRADFPADPAAPRGARRFVADVLRRAGHAGVLLDDARLVVSELATNAVIHTRSPFSVEIRPHQRSVRLSVHDASRIIPTIRPDKAHAASGRGLQLIAALAAAWGVRLTADGKVVWADLQA